MSNSNNTNNNSNDYQRWEEYLDEYYRLFEIVIHDDLTKYKKQAIAGYTNRQTQLSPALHFKYVLFAELIHGGLPLETSDRMFKGSGHTKEFKDIWWVLATWHVIGGFVSRAGGGGAHSIDVTYLKYIWLFSMGARKILDYELGLRFKTYVPHQAMDAVWTAVLQMIELNFMLCRHYKRAKGRLPFSEKRMVELCQILALHTGGDVIIRMLWSLMSQHARAVKGELRSRYHNMHGGPIIKYSAKDRRDALIAQAKCLTLVYCEYIQREPSFTWQKIKDITVVTMFNINANGFSAIRRAIGESISRAEKKNASRTTARFALERKLDRNTTQKILHLAGLSGVNANTPGSQKSRANNLRRNARHMRNLLNGLKIIDGPSTKRQRR